MRSTTDDATYAIKQCSGGLLPWHCIDRDCHTTVSWYVIETWYIWSHTPNTGDMFYLCFVNVIIEKFRRQPSTMNMASCHWMSGYLHSLLHWHVWHPFLSFLNPRLPQLFAHLTRGHLLHSHVLQFDGSITQPPSRAQFFGHCSVGHVAQGHGALTHRQFESLIGGAMNMEIKHISISFHYYCYAHIEC